MHIMRYINLLTYLHTVRRRAAKSRSGCHHYCHSVALVYVGGDGRWTAMKMEANDLHVIGLQNQRLLARIAQRMMEPSQIDNHNTWERPSSVTLVVSPLIDAHCCHMGTATCVKHPMPDRVKPLFVIFDIRALWRSALSVRVPGCQQLQMTA